MDQILNIVAALVGGLIGVGILAYFRQSPNKQNDKVVAEVNKTSKENEKLAEQAAQELLKAADQIAELEKQKNDKPENLKELADFFNNHKPRQ